MDLCDYFWDVIFKMFIIDMNCTPAVAMIASCVFGSSIRKPCRSAGKRFFQTPNMCSVQSVLASRSDSICLNNLLGNIAQSTCGKCDNLGYNQGYVIMQSRENFLINLNVSLRLFNFQLNFFCRRFSVSDGLNSGSLKERMSCL